MLSALVYSEHHKRVFFLALACSMAVVSVVYLAVDGWEGLVYPCRRQKTIHGAATLRLLEGSDVERPKRANESLFEHADPEFKKEQYINCNIFYGKYFTGDTFSASTPFIVF